MVGVYNSTMYVGYVVYNITQNVKINIILKMNEKHLDTLSNRCELNQTGPNSLNNVIKIFVDRCQLKSLLQSKVLGTHP